jgi:CRISPR system Cascade subunit CasC
MAYVPARYIDLHALHPVPASVLNRGEDDEPKSLLLGGVMRAMVSSQCWKRAIRLMLEADLDEYAARTRMLPLRVADALRGAGWPAELAAFAGAQVVRSASTEGLKTEAGQGGITSALLYLPREVLAELVELCREHRPQLEEARLQAAATAVDKARARSRDTTVPAVLPTRTVAALIKRRTATINLFGRMLAEVPGAHVDGAVQLAHAFTVHQSDPQPDYFTAVEDWAADGERGSAHVQTAFFTTGVLYRYATVNLTELARNLDGDEKQARHLLGLFTNAFIEAVPRAKKTSTAPHTLPHLVHYAVRDRRPVSYAAAFEQPVRHGAGGGHTERAVDALSRHAGAVGRLLGDRRRLAHGYTAVQDAPVTHLGTVHPSFEDLFDALTEAAARPAASAASAVSEATG